ncbi:MAG: phosphoenolpyruvate--protein phosphotransferase [Solirubrobacteraceae bacterium]
MVGLVIVSHSAALAEGVVALAREMGGEEVAIEAAGGMEDGAIGTDAERVRGAIGRARSDDGVLVLMDLGSALMSAEIAVEMADPDGGPILLSDAPLVEGAVAAAASARGGATLDEVAREARGAIRMKSEQLGGGEPDPDPAQPPADLGSAQQLRLLVENRLGLHARPAARFVGALRGLDAEVQVSNATQGRGPADGRSLTGLAVLGVRGGDEIRVLARGPEAAAALDALRALADSNWGDEPTDDRPDEPPAPQGDSGAPEAGSRLAGVAASPGIAIGPARRLQVPEPVVEDGPVGSVEEERERLDAARAAVRCDLDAARAAIAGRAGAAEADIFDAHALLLDDDALLAPAAAAIGDGSGAARAWQSAAAAAAASFRALEDPYLRERAVDVEDVARRVLGHLAGTPFAAVLDEPGIVLADELTPGEAAALDPDRAYAIATARGGATGHAAILARALGIPAVVGLSESLLAVEDGTPLVLDGEQGTVEIDPDPATIAAREERRRADDAARAEALQRAGEPGALRDGRRVEVVANIGSAAEARPAVEQGAEGVGLLRTEFLFLDRVDPPSEDEQVAVLTEIAEALDGRPLIVRTLDAGADKPLPFLRQAPEANPFLGLRGIRLSLAEPELFRTQLRAVLRVAAEHPLKLMFPMVATLGELRAARAHLDAERAALGSAAELEVGVMVEVPALALAAAQVSPEVDFFSIGTNDLTQYTMAAERGNATLAPLLDAASRAPVLRLVAAVVEAAEAHGRWVGVCGELAGDPEAAVALVGVGVRELSMAAGRIPAVKAALRETDGEAAAAAAQRVLRP